MLTIPYCLTSPTSSLEQRAADLLEKTGVIAAAPHPFGNVADPYKISKDADGPRSSSVISLLHTQLQAEAAQGWPLSVIPRPFVRTTPHDADGSEEMLLDAKQVFPSIVVPQDVHAGSTPLFPEVHFSVFADQDIEVGTVQTGRVLMALTDVRRYREPQTSPQLCFGMP